MDTDVAEPELDERGEHAPGVRFAGADEEIQIRSIAGKPMVGDSEAANDEVFNSVRVQQREKLSQVLAEQHLGDEGCAIPG